MYGDSCRTPVKIMIAIMPSMQPPITHGSAFWMPDGGMSMPRSSGGVTLISPGVSRGPRLMIGVNFLVVIRRLPPNAGCRSAPARRLFAVRVGGQGVVLEQRRLLGQHRAVDQQTDHLPRRGLAARTGPSVPGGLLVGQAVPHALRVDVVQALAVARIRRLQPDVLAAVDVDRCVAADLLDAGVRSSAARDRQVAARDHRGLRRLVTRLPLPRPAQRRGVLAQQDLQRLVGQRRHVDLLGDPCHRRWTPPTAAQISP